MKKLLFTLLAVLACLRMAASPAVPVFSDGGDAGGDHWYYIVFTAGDGALCDQGAGNAIYTRAIKKDRPGELWKLHGTPESFTLVSAMGCWCRYDGARLCTVADAADATAFRMVPAAHPEMGDSWEIELPGLEGEGPSNRWNQTGGYGLGKSIGLYTAGDRSNALRFIPSADIPANAEFTPIKEFATTPAENYSPDQRHTIWFTTPAGAQGVDDPWMEYGLPIGNGDFGAMTFGGIAQDRVQFNDKSLWTGNSTLRGSYQNFGDLYIEDISGAFGNTSDKAARDYVRGLDLEDGVSSASYTSPDGSVAYTRQYIASYPDKVVAVRLAASQAGKISVRLRLFQGVKKGLIAPVCADGRISFSGKLDLVSFKAAVKAVNTGGTVITRDDCIEVSGADELLILVAGATDYDIHSPSYLGSAADMSTAVDSRIDRAAAKGWQALLADHLADFRALSGRVDFCIGDAANDRPAEDMVRRYNNRRASRDEPCNLMLEELYYAFGRYLLISSSRGMDLPANLQGIWNHSDQPSWQCDIHSNINVQMNYWPAESANLSELHIPFLNYIYTMATEQPQWREYARRSGQSAGWTCFTQNNIFGHSDYAENYVIANAWYAAHLWQHYAYTLDREFLARKAMPVLKSCADFWMQRLVRDTDGKWVAPAEWSPEHGPAAEDGTAHAQQILAHLFTVTLRAVDILGADAGVDEAFVTELRDKLDNLDRGLATETYTGKWGSPLNDINSGDLLLREWKTSTYEAGEDGHRHQSHLMALYPFDEITPESQWFTPAVNSLSLRGDLSTGWSLAWRIALWARALDGEHASKIIRSALRHATAYTQTNGGGGVYFNLLDSHAPFQIDGNFGYTAAVTEMLLQSYGGTLRLLPALPALWASGTVRGLCAEGNFQVDQSWNQGRLITATVRSGSGAHCRIFYKGISAATVTDAVTGAPVTVTPENPDAVTFATVPGGTYTVTMDGPAGVNDIAADSVSLRIAGRIATVNAADALIEVFDLTGHLLLTARADRLDLSSLSPAVVIVRATTPAATITRKAILR